MRHVSGMHLGRPPCSIHWRVLRHAEPLHRSTADLTFHRTGWMTRLHRAQPGTEAEGAPGAHAGPLSPRAIHPRHRPLRLGPQPSLRPPRRRLLPAPPRPGTTCHTYEGLYESTCPGSTSPKQSLFRDLDKLHTQLLGQLEPTFIVV